MVEMLPCLYIQFVDEPQFSVESVWAKHLALVQNCWWNTTNRLQHPKQGRLEANQQTLLFVYHQCDIWTTVSPVRWVVCLFKCRLCALDAWFQRERPLFCICCKRQVIKCSGCPLAVWRRWLENNQLWEWRSVQHSGGPRGLWSISASAMTFRIPDIPCHDGSNKK